MGMWGHSWTDNKMFKLEEEKRRQQKVVKTFIANHPEFDYKNDNNAKVLVDFIEASQRAFTIETIEWAYQTLFVHPIGTLKGFIDGAINPNVSSITSTSTSLYYDAKNIQDGAESLARLICKEQERSERSIDTSSDTRYDKDIAPTKTVRRIKEDND